MVNRVKCKTHEKLTDGGAAGVHWVITQKPYDQLWTSPPISKNQLNITPMTLISLISIAGDIPMLTRNPLPPGGHVLLCRPCVVGRWNMVEYHD